MKSFILSLIFGLSLLGATPFLAHAAIPYFETSGVTSVDFTVGQRGAFDIALVNRGPATWLVTTGRLPNGVTLVNRGGDITRSIASIEGTPTEYGTFPVRILAMVDTTPYFLDFTVSSYTESPLILPIGVAQGRVGSPYLQALTATGAAAIHPTLFWGISSGSLPPGIALDSATGELRGTPTLAGTYRYLVTMNELGGRGRTATPREYIHTIQPAEITPVQITTRSQPVAGIVGTPYPAQIYRAQGGSGQYRFAITNGSLPPGLALDGATGIISGTPTTAGTYPATIKASDLASETNSDAVSFSLVIASAGTSPTPTPSPSPTPTPSVPQTPAGLSIVSSDVPNATVGTYYSSALSASGGTAPLTWNVASGALPPGITLSANGLLTGIPTAAGTYTAYIEVIDANRVFSGRSFTLSVNNAGTTTPEQTARLQHLAAINVRVHALVKLPDDGNRSTQEDSAVYYIGEDGRRHAFPHSRVFFSWYQNFDAVEIIDTKQMASIPLGANVTYKPGVKMVKFATDPNVYAVSQHRALRWVSSEAVAQTLYGSTWNRQIDDIADIFYTDYAFGTPIMNASDYDRASLLSSVRYISDALPLR